MSTYKFCGGTWPQCPPGSAAYDAINHMMVITNQIVNDDDMQFHICTTLMASQTR